MAEQEKVSKSMSQSSRAEEKSILLFLGLATKAGKTVSGYDAVVQAARSGFAYLVLCSEDASAATVRKVESVCRQEALPFRLFSTREKLGRFLGKDDRAVACIIDKGFAGRLLQMLGEEDNKDDSQLT